LAKEKIKLITRSGADEEVSFTFHHQKIAGFLSHPEAKAPYPAIVLLHGSDRSEARDPYYTEHAENLIQSGFAVLRYDGPGWGSANSGGASFETLEDRTAEAIAAIQYLQSRSDIKPKAIGLWGISQGGWICQMAAAAYEGVRFIIPVSGPGVTPAEQEVYRVGAESRAAGYTEDEITKAVLMRRLMADMVLSEPIYREANIADSRLLGEGPWSKMVELAYRPSPVDPGSELGSVIEMLERIKDEPWAPPLHLDQVLPMLNSLPPQAWGMAKTQMRAVMQIDPANFLTKVHCPVLAIFGEADTSIPVAKCAVLYQRYLEEAGNQALTIKIFPKASHTIRTGETFASGYFELMVDWLRHLPIQ
jgi:dienelactone hydrolase